MSKKLLFNFNREVIQNYTYVKYVGTIITATNTLEKPIKSAILKGNTLVNCLKPQSGYYSDYQISSTYKDFTLFKPNTLYTFINNWDKGGTLAIRSNNGQITNVNFAKNSSTLFTTPSAITNVEIYSPNGIHGGTPSDCEKWKTAFIVIEGDYTNVDIPYFEGMQSVKLPVLTTSNGDGTKTNILTVNEEVELRGIGDVRDTLDLMTGQVTERIGEVVLDGSENWVVDKDVFNNNTYRFILTIGNMIRKNWHDTITQEQFVKSNVFRSLDLRVEAYSLDTEHLTGWDFSRIVLSINKAKLSENSVNALKTYLQQNPITVQYQLATESVKTVDLSILDQNENKVSSISSFNDTTHITASSETIPPIFEGYLATKEVE